MLIPSALEFLLKHKALFPPERSVLDFGDQKLFDRQHAINLFPEISDQVTALSPYEQVSLIYEILGFKERKCLDYNENADFRVNLNYTSLSIPEINSRFDFVTNQGFSEHVFNQHATFEAIHYTCKQGGYMLHVLPCQGWADGGGLGHGFYMYQPNFFKHLAEVNNYRLVDLQLSPFSPSPCLLEYSPRDYPYFVNFHLSSEYQSQHDLGENATFASIIALMKMPDIKLQFVSPHE